MSLDSTLKHRLDLAFGEVRSVMPRDQQLLIEGFLRADEFGVALDWIVATLVAEKCQVSQHVADQLDHLAGEMEMTTELANVRSRLHVIE